MDCHSSGIAGAAPQSTACARPGIPRLAASVTCVDSSGPYSPRLVGLDFSESAPGAIPLKRSSCGSFRS